MKQKILFCRMLISNFHKSIIVRKFIVGVCSEARLRTDKTLNTAAPAARLFNIIL